MKNKILIIIYAIGAVVTFGRAWDDDYSECFDPDGCRLIAATGSAAAWPLYWSTVIWKYVQ